MKSLLNTSLLTFLAFALFSQTCFAIEIEDLVAVKDPDRFEELADCETWLTSTEELTPYPFSKNYLRKLHNRWSYLWSKFRARDVSEARLSQMEHYFSQFHLKDQGYYSSSSFYMSQMSASLIAMNKVAMSNKEDARFFQATKQSYDQFKLFLKLFMTALDSKNLDVHTPSPNEIGQLIEYSPKLTLTEVKNGIRHLKYLIEIEKHVVDVETIQRLSNISSYSTHVLFSIKIELYQLSILILEMQGLVLKSNLTLFDQLDGASEAGEVYHEFLKSYSKIVKLVNLYPRLLLDFLDFQP